MVQRGYGAGLVAAALVILLSLPVQANQQDGDRDGQSRHETGPLSYIPLVTGSGHYTIDRIVIIQAKLVQVIDIQGFGVGYSNLNKIDLGEVPLVGQLFNREFSADDFTAGSRVGAVYLAGGDTLAAVINDTNQSKGRKVVVVNGDGAYHMKTAPQVAEIAPTKLGDFGALPSVRSLLTETAVPETTAVLAGLTRNSVPATADNVPASSDVPKLQKLFKGTAHRSADNQLLLLVKPSILIRDGD